MEDCLAHIERTEPEIHAFADFQPDQARAAAKAADAISPDRRGPLHGLPIGIKEVFDVAGMRCSWGTRIHRERIPSDDAAAVARLKAAGAIITGTLVSTEYAIAAAGPTVNPHDVSRTPGGSSSGPAAAVASGMIPCALGSQTVGSIIRPAAYCGIYGLKPTYGAIPSHGGMTLSPLLDHPGVMARTPKDIELLCSVLFDAKQRDPDMPGRSLAGIPDSVEGLRILVTHEALSEQVSQASARTVDAAADRLAGAGAQVEEFSFPTAFLRTIEILYTIMCRDIAVAHGADYDSAKHLMSPALRALVVRGRGTSDADYDRAVRDARQLRDELETSLGPDGVLISPPALDVAPPRVQGTGSNGPQALWSLTGLPVMAIPLATHEGLPLGIQAGAGAGRENLILAVAKALDQN